MAVEKQLPSRPTTGYHLATVRQVFHCFWNRMIIALAIRGILVLYGLLHFLLTKCRAE